MRQSMTAGRRDDEMEGKEGQDAEMAADAARKRRVDDVRDLMDPYGLLRRRRGSLSSTMEGEFGDEEDAQRWEDEEGFRGWDEIALGLFAPAVAAEEEEEEMRGRSRAGRIGGATIPTTDEAWAYPVSDEASTRGSRFGGTSSTVKKRSVLVSDMEGNGDHKKQKLIGGISFKRVFACGLCGVLTKRHALWKRRIGSGGSRSVAHIRILCNSCGLKACFGRSPKDFENAVLDDGSDDEDPEDGEISWKRGAMASEDLEEEGGTVGSVSPEEQELRRLKKVLDRRLRYSKRLKGLLEALRKEDASVDRGFRRAVVWCRQVKQGTFCQKEEEERDVVNVHGVDEVGWGQQVLNKFVRAVTTSRT
ncbi:hypothetical protein BC830DRAFT_90056 [Chytriomyces sp. MP71]|nr:hypothetical protein BC830DRAFT_90056 [Chytriomyces sp. MP71]